MEENTNDSTETISDFEMMRDLVESIAEQCEMLGITFVGGLSHYSFAKRKHQMYSFHGGNPLAALGLSRVIYTAMDESDMDLPFDDDDDEMPPSINDLLED